MKPIWWLYWTPYTNWFWSPARLTGYEARRMTQDPYEAEIFK